MRTLILLLLAFLCVAALLGFARRLRTKPALSRQDGAAQMLTRLADRLRACADQAAQPHADVFWDMAAHLERIRSEVQDSETDLNQARRFIGHHAPMIVGLVEKFVELDAKARPEQADRLARMAAQLHGYRDVFARVEAALIENDFAEIEATMDALDTQLARLDF